eukprot:g14171.t1
MFSLWFSSHARGHTYTPPVRLITRLKGQKLKTVQELQRLNFRILAVGNSFNDIDMIHAAEKGVLFRPSEAVKKDHPEIPVVTSYDELKKCIAQVVETVEPNSKKQKTG